MKKIVSISSLILSLVIFFWLYEYAKISFSYQATQNVGYVFYWSAILFLISLFAAFLEEKKYKMWLYLSGAYMVLSLSVAFMVAGGNGMILSFDGKLLTWFFAGLYSFISVVYFITQFVKNRR